MPFDLPIEEVIVDHDLYFHEHKVDPRREKLVDLQFPDLLESIRQHGQQTPIIINSEGRLLQGFKRLVCLLQLGAATVKAVRQ